MRSRAIVDDGRMLAGAGGQRRRLELAVLWLLLGGVAQFYHVAVVYLYCEILVSV